MSTFPVRYIASDNDQNSYSEEEEVEHVQGWGIREAARMDEFLPTMIRANLIEEQNRHLLLQDHCGLSLIAYSLGLILGV